MRNWHAGMTNLKLHFPGFGTFPKQAHRFAKRPMRRSNQRVVLLFGEICPGDVRSDPALLGLEKRSIAGPSSPAALAIPDPRGATVDREDRSHDLAGSSVFRMVFAPGKAIRSLPCAPGGLIGESEIPKAFAQTRVLLEGGKERIPLPLLECSQALVPQAVVKQTCLRQADCA